MPPDKAAPRELHPDTVAVHGGQRTNGTSDFPVPPLVANAAIPLDSMEHGLAMLTREEVENVAYQRYSNPTVRVLEEKLREMEGCRFALAVNSGMAACYLLFRALTQAGEHVIALHSLYHEISDQLIFDRKGSGVDVSLVSDYGPDGFAEAFRPETRMVFIESPTNPSMLDVDIPMLAEACRERQATFVVDNTLLTPEYQKPLDLGAHVTICSTTKMLNGHGDALGGVIGTNDEGIAASIRSLRDNTGLALDPFSAWLTVRGLRTLRLRLERQTANAEAVIRFLRSDYPQLEIRHPKDTRHRERNQVSGWGGVMAVVFPECDQAATFMRSLSLFTIATTFGNLESQVYHFGTFARPTRDITRIGIPLGLVRLSIGIEHPDDILADIDQALGHALG